MYVFIEDEKHVLLKCPIYADLCSVCYIWWLYEYVI